MRTAVSPHKSQARKNLAEAVAVVAAGKVAIRAAPKRSMKFAHAARHCVDATKFRTSSNATKCCWFKLSRKSAAIKVRRLHPISA